MLHKIMIVRAETGRMPESINVSIKITYPLSAASLGRSGGIKK
jgi:hypothetical protein